MKGYDNWNYPVYELLNDPDYGKPTPVITRLAPYRDRVEIGWKNRSGNPLWLVWQTADGALQKCRVEGEKMVLDGLKCGEEYTLWLEDDKEKQSSKKRRICCADVPGAVVNYLHPEDSVYAFSGHSLCSPSIMKLPSGALLVSMDIYQNLGGQNLTKIFRSEDGGRSFTFVTDLMPCFWGKLFWHREALYMLAVTTEYGNLVIGKSLDEGKNWTPPVTLFTGNGNRFQPGPHKAPTNLLEENGRLWTAIDYGTWEQGGHSSGVLSIDSNADLMRPENWSLSGFFTYSDKLPGAPDHSCRKTLEGNMVKAPDGTLFNMLRFQCEPDYDKAILLQVDTRRPEAAPSFYKILDFYGGLSKFWIEYDAVSGYYISLGNRVTNPKSPMQRNVLSLSKSKDLYHWEMVGDILNYAEEDSQKVGVQYPDAVIDGENLLFVSRTSMAGAANFHDSNYITLHRVPDFRKLL